MQKLVGHCFLQISEGMNMIEFPEFTSLLSWTGIQISHSCTAESWAPWTWIWSHTSPAPLLSLHFVHPQLHKPPSCSWNFLTSCHKWTQGPQLDRSTTGERIVIACPYSNSLPLYQIKSHLSAWWLAHCSPQTRSYKWCHMCMSRSLTNFAWRNWGFWSTASCRMPNEIASSDLAISTLRGIVFVPMIGDRSMLIVWICLSHTCWIFNHHISIPEHEFCTKHTAWDWSLTYKLAFPCCLDLPTNDRDP